MAERLGSAVATVVGGLYPSYTVRNRKVPDLADGENPPLQLVSVREDERRPFQFEDTHGDVVSYTVAVVLVTRSQGLLSDDETARQWKEDVRSRLASPTLTGMPEIHHVEILPGDPFPRAGLSATLNYTGVGVRYHCGEDRG